MKIMIQSILEYVSYLCKYTCMTGIQANAIYWLRKDKALATEE